MAAKKDAEKIPPIHIYWSDVSNVPLEVLNLWAISRRLPGWSKDNVQEVIDEMTFLTEMPLACKGSECDFADTCPLIKFKTVGKWAEGGHCCPREIEFGFRKFFGYVNALKIKPTDFTDIQHLNELIRLHIHMHRCDLLIRKEKPTETIVTGYGANATTQKKVNTLLAWQQQLRADINKTYGYLLASREGKLKESQIGRSAQDASNLFADLLAAAKPEGK